MRYYFDFWEFKIRAFFLQISNLLSNAVICPLNQFLVFKLSPTLKSIWAVLRALKCVWWQIKNRYGLLGAYLGSGRLVVALARW